jgi:hypothetical protein
MAHATPELMIHGDEAIVTLNSRNRSREWRFAIESGEGSYEERRWKRTRGGETAYTFSLWRVLRKNESRRVIATYRLDAQLDTCTQLRTHDR